MKLLLILNFLALITVSWSSLVLNSFDNTNFEFISYLLTNSISEEFPEIFVKHVDSVDCKSPEFTTALELKNSLNITNDFKTVLEIGSYTCWYELHGQQAHSAGYNAVILHSLLRDCKQTARNWYSNNESPIPVYVVCRETDLSSAISLDLSVTPNPGPPAYYLPVSWTITILSLGKGIFAAYKLYMRVSYSANVLVVSNLVFVFEICNTFCLMFLWGDVATIMGYQIVAVGFFWNSLSYLFSSCSTYASSLAFNFVINEVNRNPNAESSNKFLKVIFVISVSFSIVLGTSLLWNNGASAVIFFGLNAVFLCIINIWIGYIFITRGNQLIEMLTGVSKSPVSSNGSLHSKGVRMAKFLKMSSFGMFTTIIGTILFGYGNAFGYVNMNQFSIILTHMSGVGSGLAQVWSIPSLRNKTRLTSLHK